MGWKLENLLGVRNAYILVIQNRKRNSFGAYRLIELEERKGVLNIRNYDSFGITLGLVYCQLSNLRSITLLKVENWHLEQQSCAHAGQWVPWLAETGRGPHLMGDGARHDKGHRLG